VHEVLGLPRPLSQAQRCLVMGVVNVTPDSFSDGGRWFEPDEAIAHGLRLVTEGADLLDVGGESTRPGAARIPVEEERRRVLPVVAALAAAGAVVSVDTMRAEVADAALAAGAALVNDVSGGLADPLMAGLVARARVPFVAMHWRGPSRVMESLASYGDVVEDVCAELSRRLDALVEGGVDARQVVLDPGFGFAKRSEHSWALLAHLDRVLALGRPVVVGTSRKRFLGQAVAAGSIVPGAGGTAGARMGEPAPEPPEWRDGATAATTALAAAAGAWGVRVHEVPASADAVRVVARIAAARTTSARGATA
jgi:dihydropteroate synthase